MTPLKNAYDLIYAKSFFENIFGKSVFWLNGVIYENHGFLTLPQIYIKIFVF